MKTINSLLLTLLSIFILFNNSTLNAKDNTLLVPADSWAPFRIIKENQNIGIDFDLLKEIEKASYKPNNNVDLYFVISKKSPYAKDLVKFSKTIKDIVEEGKVKEFAKKYYQ
jgi:hypothetical protein